MILWWLGDIVLLLVVLPIVIHLVRGVFSAAQGIVHTWRRSPEPRPPGRRTSTPCRCC